MPLFDNLSIMLGNRVSQVVNSQLFGWIRAVSEALDGTDPILTDSFRAKNVVSTNVASLAAYTVTASASNDNVLGVQGDVILLVAQTVTTQNGPWVVGVVTGTTAPLTRPAWWSSGDVFKTGVIIRVGSLGTLYKNTNWQAMRAAGDTFTVDTTDPELYPQILTRQVVLVNGSTGAISLPIRSTSSGVAISRSTANTTAATIMYAPTIAGAIGIVAGALGTGSATVQATVAAGTINAADLSTLNITILNQV